MTASESAGVKTTLPTDPPPGNQAIGCAAHREGCASRPAAVAVGNSRERAKPPKSPVDVVDD